MFSICQPCCIDSSVNSAFRCTNTGAWCLVTPMSKKIRVMDKDNLDKVVNGVNCKIQPPCLFMSQS